MQLQKMCSCFRNLKFPNIMRVSKYLNIIYWLHKSRGCHQKSRISNTASCWNDLTSSTMQRLRGNLCINNFELHISDRFITEGSFTSSPLKPVSITGQLWEPIENELEKGIQSKVTLAQWSPSQHSASPCQLHLKVYHLIKY